jgi:hypothetical protein
MRLVVETASQPEIAQRIMCLVSVPDLIEITECIRQTVTCGTRAPVQYC